MYALLGIDDVSEKVIVFSDGLDLERCLELKSANDELGFQGDEGLLRRTVRAFESGLADTLDSSGFLYLATLRYLAYSFLRRRDIFNERFQESQYRR